jgi:exodeoxyribonuclease V alpha subunit
LPFDVVVVDETSMVSLTMMARLLEALSPDTRLILVGDPDQLASVEAGAVLADLVVGLTARAPDVDSGAPPTGQAGQVGGGRGGVVLLHKTWRFGGDIAELAAAVRDGDADGALAVLGRGRQSVARVGPGDPGARADVVAGASAVRAAALAGDARDALSRLENHRLLCAHRTGPRGVQEWTRQIENWLAAEHDDAREGEWYAGRPVLVMANDYAIGLFNGDTGVVVREATGDLRVVFTRLPEEDSPLSTRELLYTALTRAQTFVRLVGTVAELRAAISRPAARASGLRLRLADRSG